jgi:predicted phage-related endonuclease
MNLTGEVVDVTVKDSADIADNKSTAELTAEKSTPVTTAEDAKLLAKFKESLEITLGMTDDLTGEKLPKEIACKATGYSKEFMRASTR